MSQRFYVSANGARILARQMFRREGKWQMRVASRWVDAPRSFDTRDAATLWRIAILRDRRDQRMQSVRILDALIADLEATLTVDLKNGGKKNAAP